MYSPGTFRITVDICAHPVEFSSVYPSTFLVTYEDILCILVLPHKPKNVLVMDQYPLNHCHGASRDARHPTLGGFYADENTRERHGPGRRRQRENVRHVC